MCEAWFRLVEATDETFFNECLAKDEVHQKLGIKFSDLEKGDSYLVSDEHGPLMFVRLQNALRVAIQFNPDVPLRSARAAKQVVNWFTGMARGRKATEVIIRPGGEAVQFADRLGFLPFDGKYIEVN